MKGSFYELKINDNLFIYFQFVCKDYEQGNSDVIRMFNKTSSVSLNKESLNEIYESGTWFYHHTIILGSNDYREIGIMPVNEKELEHTYFYSEFHFIGILHPFKIRKINQSINDANVSEEDYAKYKNYAYLDGVIGSKGLIQRIPKKIFDPEYKGI